MITGMACGRVISSSALSGPKPKAAAVSRWPLPTDASPARRICAPLAPPQTEIAAQHDQNGFRLTPAAGSMKYTSSTVTISGRSRSSSISPKLTRRSSVGFEVTPKVSTMAQSVPPSATTSDIFSVSSRPASRKTRYS